MPLRGVAEHPPAASGHGTEVDLVDRQYDLADDADVELAALDELLDQNAIEALGRIDRLGQLTAVLCDRALRDADGGVFRGRFYDRRKFVPIEFAPFDLNAGPRRDRQ